MRLARYLVFIASVAMVCRFSAAADAPRPNVVFFLVDDLGWRDLACYGQEVFTRAGFLKKAL